MRFECKTRILFITVTALKPSGISMLEIAIGRFPFPESKNLFEQLKRICHDDPPKLPPNKFSSDFEDFINRW